MMLDASPLPVYRGHIRTVAPEGTAVSLPEAKAHLRLDPDITFDDSNVIALLMAAEDYIERATRRALLPQTWRVTFDGFPCVDTIELPRCPLRSVTSVEYRDATGATQTLDPAQYRVDTDSLKGRLQLKGTYRWPDTDNEIGAVWITYVAGYEDAAKIPLGLRAAIKLTLADYYENREGVITGTTVTPMSAVERLVWLWKVPEL